MENTQSPPQPKLHRLPAFFTTVTPLTKLLAAALFIIFPFTSFYLGTKYQQLISPASPTPLLIASKIIPTPTPSPILIPQGDKNIYINQKYGFLFSYPKEWKLREHNPDYIEKYGTIVDVTDPDMKRTSEGYFDSFNVSIYKSINVDSAKGGSWVGQREYKNLDDFFTDPNVPSIHKIGTTFVDSKPAYDVIFGGNGQMYGVMIQTDHGLYELGFPRASIKTKMIDAEKQILSSFKFLL